MFMRALVSYFDPDSITTINWEVYGVLASNDLCVYALAYLNDDIIISGPIKEVYTDADIRVYAKDKILTLSLPVEVSIGDVDEINIDWAMIKEV